MMRWPTPLYRLPHFFISRIKMYGTISSLQIAEITGKAYCGVLKVIRKMDIMRVKITMKNIFSLFVCLKKCCTFVVLQLTIKYANGIFYARKETYILINNTGNAKIIE